MEKIIMEQEPIISKLKDISDKTITPEGMANIMQNIPAIDYNRIVQAIAPQPGLPMLEQPATGPSTRHTRSKSGPVKIHMNEGIDPRVIEQYTNDMPGLQMPNDILKHAPFTDEKIKDLRTSQKDLVKVIKSVASKSRHDEKLKTDLNNLQKYNEALKMILSNYTKIQKDVPKERASSSVIGNGIRSRIFYTDINELYDCLNILIGEL